MSSHPLQQPVRSRFPSDKGSFTHATDYSHITATLQRHNEALLKEEVKEGDGRKNECIPLLFEVNNELAGYSHTHTLVYVELSR